MINFYEASNKFCFGLKNFSERFKKLKMIKLSFNLITNFFSIFK